MNLGLGEKQILQGQPGAMQTPLGLLSCSLKHLPSLLSLEMSLLFATSTAIIMLDTPHPLFLDAMGKVTSVLGGLGAAGIQA